MFDGLPLIESRASEEHEIDERDRDRRYWEIIELQRRQQSKRAPRKVTCEECFFRHNLLCALQLEEPCATFRPNEAQLKPAPQLQFVFRQERRSQSAWAFPTAQEQAALHA